MAMGAIIALLAVILVVVQIGFSVHQMVSEKRREAEYTRKRDRTHPRPIR